MKGESLLQQVLDAPDQEELRLVYADWLLEHDDPRGELMALQLQRRKRVLNEVEQAREAELIELHGDRWQGQLSRITQFVEFEGGFLHACSLREVPAWAAQQREWRTVRHVGVNDDAYFLGALLESVHLERLQSLRLSDQCVGLALPHLPPHLERVIVDGGRFEVPPLFKVPSHVRRIELRAVRQKLDFEREGDGWAMRVALRESKWAFEKGKLPSVLAKLPKGLVTRVTGDDTALVARVEKALGDALRK